jgi:MFS family permease
VSLELQVLLLALEAALYPTLLAAVVVLLGASRPKTLLAAYLGGGLTMSIVAGCLIVYGLQHSGALNSRSSTVSWTADLAVGGLALLLAVALAAHADARFAERRRARRRGRQPREPQPEAQEPWSERVLARGSVPLVFLAALAINLPGAAYVIALKDIAAEHMAAGRAFALIVAFNAIMFLLAEVPLAGLLFAPERTNALVGRFNAWLSRNGRSIAIAGCAVLGGFLIVRGLLNA